MRAHRDRQAVASLDSAHGDISHLCQLRVDLLADPRSRDGFEAAESLKHIDSFARGRVRASKVGRWVFSSYRKDAVSGPQGAIHIAPAERRMHPRSHQGRKG